MSENIRNVLFLCTGNSARSVMAEVLLNHLGQGRFRAYSAGSHPAGQVNPLTLETLRKAGHGIEGLRSKSWDEFAQPCAPSMDFIFTVCDNAAGEVCPIWPGQPISAHWGFEDPAAAEGSPAERALVFARIYREIATRIELLTHLPLAALDRLALKKKFDDLGRLTSEQL